MNKNFLRMGHIFLFSIILLTIPTFSQAEVKNKSSRLEEVINQARQQKIAGKSAWLNLLHYKRTWSGSLESQVDGKDFFLSEQGATNAQAELEATLTAFFKSKRTAHAMCLFPARLHWLSKQLNLKKHLMTVNCKPYEDWREGFDIEQITLLFPSMHLDNPASMFGHTFIRFDRKDNNHLLSKTLSYAAAFDETDSALTYSWKGITGGYPGKFYIRAYFDALQTYSDIEQRDIWEYKLNLTHDEIEQLIRHLWEVKQAHFKYYFFKENCSYRLLALLDVAREDINMSMFSHPVYAIPVDTVRDVERSGLIAAKNYRPSVHNKIKKMANNLNEDELKIALSMVNHEVPIHMLNENYNDNDQAKILEFSDEVITLKKELSPDDELLQLEILSARSHFTKLKNTFNFTPNISSPEDAHKAARWNLSLGNRDKEMFWNVGIRPVFHDLLDEPDGFINGAAISVLDLQFRIYENDDRLTLDELNFFTLSSIAAIEPWVTPLSKKISFKIVQKNISDVEQINAVETKMGIGYALEFKRALVYLLMQGQVDYAYQLQDKYEFYLGSDAGLIYSFKGDYMSFQTTLNIQNLQQVNGGNFINSSNISVQFNLKRDHALRFKYKMNKYNEFDVEERRIDYLIYF